MNLRVDKIDLSPRFISIFIDQFALGFVAMICSLPLVILELFQGQGLHNDNSFETSKVQLFTAALIATVYFNKDIYLGRSPGKIKSNLQVVDVSTQKSATPFKCFVRNTTLFIWPIEFIVTLFNSQKRIGDYIAGTELQIHKPENDRPSKFWRMIVLFMLSFIPVLIVILFVDRTLNTYVNPWLRQF